MTDKMTCIIVEDEPDNRQNLRLLLNNYCPHIRILDEAANVAEAKVLLARTQPDIVFLDVEMPDGTGFDLLRSMETVDFAVIFVTAYSHYAVKAIKFSAVDYILKPIDIEDLTDAVQKAGQRTTRDDSTAKIKSLLSNLNISDTMGRRIPLASADALRMVEVRRIIRLEGENNYTRFYIKDDSPLLISRTIKEYANMLEEYGFFRVHQSHVVNLRYVESYVKGDGGYLVLSDGTEVGVARNRKNDLMEKLMEM